MKDFGLVMSTAYQAAHPDHKPVITASHSRASALVTGELLFGADNVLAALPISKRESDYVHADKLDEALKAVVNGKQYLELCKLLGL